MFDIQAKYKKLFLTNILMKLALYFPILCWQRFNTELMQIVKTSVWYWIKTSKEYSHLNLYKISN